MYRVRLGWVSRKDPPPVTNMRVFGIPWLVSIDTLLIFHYGLAIRLSNSHRSCQINRRKLCLSLYSIAKVFLLARKYSIYKDYFGVENLDRYLRRIRSYPVFPVSTHPEFYTMICMSY